jgi:hypothetical protein
MRHFLLALVALMLTAGSALAESHYVPPVGYVPTSDTAIGIARAVLSAFYGADVIKEEEPLTAQRTGDVWLVKGTLHCGWFARICLGGVAEIEINSNDGSILGMIHGK